MPWPVRESVEVESRASLDALTRLGVRQRTALVPRFHADRSEAGVARALDCHPGTARSLVHRGLRGRGTTAVGSDTCAMATNVKQLELRPVRHLGDTRSGRIRHLGDGRYGRLALPAAWPRPPSSFPSCSRRQSWPRGSWSPCGETWADLGSIGRGVAPASARRGGPAPAPPRHRPASAAFDGLRTGLVTVWPREGRAPSVSEAAERALVSNATAYRYFASDDEL